VASADLQVEIVSPERVLHRGGARSVRAEAHDGSVGVLPGHAPLLALLGTGRVALAAPGGGGTRSFAIRGGFVQVLGSKVTLLVTQAVAAEDVDAAQAAKDLDKVKEALHAPKSEEDFARLLDERRWLEALAAIAGAR
jgi:F-type H+-transporting ATPase subunit epsilon